MKSYVICKVCGEKNQIDSSLCRNCESVLLFDYSSKSQLRKVLDIFRWFYGRKYFSTKIHALTTAITLIILSIFYVTVFVNDFDREIGEGLFLIITSLLFFLFGFLIILCIGMMGLDLFYSFMKDLSEALASKKWPTVEGTVDSSEILTWREQSGEGNRSYFPLIDYSYFINERRFQSRRIKVGRQETLWKRRAQKMVAKYPTENIVKVYYDPDSPENAVLQPGFNLGILGSFLKLVIVPVIGFIFLNIWFL